MQKRNDCEICLELSGAKTSVFHEYYPEFATRTLLETDNFLIMPCIGQLVQMHCMLIPKKHDCTIAKSSSGLLPEIEFLLTTFSNSYVSENEKLLIFEHGVNNNEQGGCGIYHAHLHLLPLQKHIHAFESLEYNTSDLFTDLKTVFSIFENETPYLLVGTQKDGFSCKKLKNPIESQYLRKILSMELELPEWNWKKYGRQESVCNLLESIRT